MGFAARVLADSISPRGVRLTTLEVTLPRIVLAEFNTHRVFSRNSASSRAIPVEKRIADVEADPFVPEAFGKNQKGMQATDVLSVDEESLARGAWLNALQYAVTYAGELARVGVHKQLANRLLEPFSWHTIIVTATEWSNFYALRCNPMAQPEIRRAAELMRDAMLKSGPNHLPEGGWHLPLVRDVEHEEFQVADLVKLSAARCARVSYLTHDGRRDPQADLALYDRLASAGHMSPLEHPARATNHRSFVGNFCGWAQHRKEIAGEDVFSGGQS